MMDALLRSGGALIIVCAAVCAQPEPRLTPAQAREEPVLFTPAGFERPGEARWLDDATAGTGGRVAIVVRDAATGAPTPCRVNVIGADGNYYQPPRSGPLSQYALTGVYTGNAGAGGAWGNRLGTGPYRHIGRFFYSTGRAEVRVPAGRVRIEVGKGFEYRPETITVGIAPGAERTVEVKLTRAAPMAPEGYHSGELHLHFPRETEAGDQLIFDLLEAEDLRHGFILAPNRPAGPYTGEMDRMAVPQRLGLGARSIRPRGDFQIMSGQEYRSTTYGHLKLLLLDELVFAGRSHHADFWPVYGEVAAAALARGGIAVQAHGGYAQEVYADVALGTISAVELLQFGHYRGIGLEDWYHMLNAGFRVPAEGSSDYPACRMLADSRTYVHAPTAPTMPEWLHAMAAGRSFFTTGPLVLLEVEGEKPGAHLRRQGPGPHALRVWLRARCEVTAITDLDLIVNGEIVRRLKVPRDAGQGRWLEFEHLIELTESAWVAARAHSLSPGGLPDAEAHTNPIYVYLDGRAPYRAGAVDAWLAKIDGQIAVHAARDFPERARVLAYFERARAALMQVRRDGGRAAGADQNLPLRPSVKSAP